MTDPFMVKIIEEVGRIITWKETPGLRLRR